MMEMTTEQQCTLGNRVFLFVFFFSTQKKTGCKVMLKFQIWFKKRSNTWLLKHEGCHRVN